MKQIVSLNIEMASDIKKAAKTDSIAEALNYKAVAKRLIQFVETSNFQLIESLAEACAKLVLAEFDVSWVKLKASKPAAVTGSKTVGVIIERGIS